MGQPDTKSSVLSRPGQPTRGLDSYVGKTSCDPNHRFSIHDYDSAYLQECTRREALYNSIPFDDLYARIKNSISRWESKEVAELNSTLADYVVLLEPSGLNPLDPSQSRKISSLFDFFKNSLQKEMARAEKEWKERERKINPLAVPLHYKKEEIARLDLLTERYLQRTSRPWLDGLFLISGNKSIVDYGVLIRAITHSEENFWRPYLQKYQSAIFDSIKSVEEEKKYLHHYYQEQFAFSSKQVPLHLLRLQLSLPYQLLQEINYLQDNLASCNEIKVFCHIRLRSLEEDRKRLSAKEKSLDSLTEIRSRYPSLPQQFPDLGRQLLYFSSLVSTYERQRDDFQKVLQEQVLLLEQQRVAERKNRDSCFSHPLIISLEPFDLCTYVRRYTPSAREMQQMQELLLSNDSWENKIEKLPLLLNRNPSYHSERDKEFLHSVIFALKASRTEGILEHLCREKPALDQKMNAVLSRLKDYARQYVQHYTS